LKRGLSGFLAAPLRIAPKVDRDGAVLLALAASPELRALHLHTVDLGAEGFLIRSARVHGHSVIVVAANSEGGLLYGAFALLRRIQTHEPVDRLGLRDRPALPLRMLDHWDNLDGFVERGYAGKSLWDWKSLPQRIDPRYIDYARADASIGINGVVVNNVNANAQILTPTYLQKVKALADTFRPWAVRVYLSARFTAPMELGGLKTADPLDPGVRAWWRAEANEIYRLIPDFGGFLVKANSEGQPGPQDYHRTHADGANMLADALRPHGGVVIWRAFVYSSSDGDRAKQAYDEFKPLDGKFARNVIVQVKNGPIDFQPREPFSPLFGAMPHTRLAMEVEITKEYLGFNTHLAYLGTMWEEALRSRTARPSAASIVADSLGAMAGVANTGTDRNWSGSQFDQANWYAFGRLAWNPRADAKQIAEDWTRMTWGNDPRLVSTIVDMMMGSRQAVVNYMTPLGLAHQMGTGHHYGPAPWVNDQSRPEWNPVYYNLADRNGIGFDRTASGSDAIAQYAPGVARRFASLDTVGDDYLLWFHHVPWTMRLDTGRTVWDELLVRYDRGVGEVAEMQREWQMLRPLVDPQRFDEVANDLAIQHREAKWWRNASIAYFRSVSQRPLPAGIAPPERSLDYYQSLRFPSAPGWPH
jgi:alpha-glucuronidase